MFFSFFPDLFAISYILIRIFHEGVTDFLKYIGNNAMCTFFIYFYLTLPNIFGTELANNSRIFIVLKILMQQKSKMRVILMYIKLRRIVL